MIYIYILLGTPLLKEKEEIILSTSNLDNTVNKAIEGLNVEFYVSGQKIEIWEDDKGYIGEIMVSDDYTAYRLQQELSRIIITHSQSRQD